MRGSEVLRYVNSHKSADHMFVKWWRKENDFLDYDLLDRFVQSVALGEEIGGVDLLTMDDMWDTVKRIGGTRVKLVHESNGDRIEWVHKGASGVEKDVCSYSPEMVMRIFDVETKGNPVDS